VNRQYANWQWGASELVPVGDIRKVLAFDYIVVGAGAAGCVLAHRLSQDKNVSVALIEAGGSSDHAYVKMPKGLAKVMVDPAKIWAYLANPEPGNNFSKEEVWARGRLLGGSTAINGMMYVRGQPDDFDEIAALSSDDWSWKYISQAYKAIESHELGRAETRGESGPLKVSVSPRRNPLLQAMVDAGSALGWQVRDDFNQPDNDECISYASCTIWEGVRQSAYDAFVKPCLDRTNLTVISGKAVDRIKLDGNRAVGIILAANGSAKGDTLLANREVILAGGALASPGILQRSGIGPSELLGRLGIDVVCDSPEVGQNLQEHRCIMLQWKLDSPYSDNRQYGGLKLVRNVLQYQFSKKGPMAAPSFEVCARMKSSPEVERPDIQFIMAPYSFDFESGRKKLEKHPGMVITANVLRPTSKGQVNINSTDPNELPELIPNYRSTEHDRQLMIELVNVARRYAQQEPLKSSIVAETYPGPTASTDEDIIAAYDRYASCGFHAVGSCRMGADAASVVDPQMRVRGVENLRVMDTSIMPKIPSGNTSGPTMAMAWRGADIILESHA
jgi:choline dehydrogenase-like flavoprotein